MHLVIALSLLIPAEVLPQTSRSSFAISTVYSFDAGGPLSRIQTVDFLALRIEYGYRLVAARHAHLNYVVGGVPLALVLHNPIGEVVAFRYGWALRGTIDRTTTYGAGISPLGLRLDVLPAAILSPSVHVSGGVLVFSRPVPASNTHRANLTGEVGLALRLRLTRYWRVGAGLAFQHLSNLGWGEVNPGLDSKLVYVGANVVP